MPGVDEGAHYKFEIRGADGSLRLKADPEALRAEHPPKTASEIFVSRYPWGDDDWMRARRRAPPPRGAGVDLRGPPALVALEPAPRATAR